MNPNEFKRLLNEFAPEQLEESGRYDLWQQFFGMYYSKVTDTKSIQEDPLKFIEWMQKNFNPPK